MKRGIAIILAVAMLLGFCSCAAAPKDLQFYVVAGEDAVGIRTDSALLELAKKQGRLAFSGADIKGWHWESHHIYLKGVSVKGGEGSALFMADPQDIFLLVLDGEVLFTGEFQQSVNTVAEGKDLYILDGKGDDFYLCCHRVYEADQDPRNSETLYAFLAECGLLIAEEGSMK